VTISIRLDLTCLTTMYSRLRLTTENGDQPSIEGFLACGASAARSAGGYSRATVAASFGR